MCMRRKQINTNLINPLSLLPLTAKSVSRYTRTAHWTQERYPWIEKHIQAATKTKQTERTVCCVTLDVCGTVGQGAVQLKFAHCYTHIVRSARSVARVLSALAQLHHL
jgi:hypothetical protein